MSDKRGSIDRIPPDLRSARGFPKGVSGNPGGKTKAQVAMRRLVHELIADETDQGREIIDFVVKVLRGDHDDCKDAKSMRWAADFLADRLWGRAPMKVEIGEAEDTLTPEDRAMLDALRMSPHERRERIAELRRRLMTLAPAVPAAPAGAAARAAARDDDPDIG